MRLEDKPCLFFSGFTYSLVDTGEKTKLVFLSALSIEKSGTGEEYLFRIASQSAICAQEQASHSPSA